MRQRYSGRGAGSALAAAALLTFTIVGTAKALAEQHQKDPPFQLQGGETSMDALLDRFIEAVQRSDKEALNSLRLTREEYEEIIVPGRVPPGSPPRQVTRMVTRHFWEMLDYKTSLFVDVLLERFGGKTLERGEVRFTKKPESYDWYRTWGQVRQTATEPDGTVHVVKTGSIAEVGGRYKFVSFQWDN